MGELRERRRLAPAVAAALGGMLVPVAIYLAVNAGRSSADGWGVAMSTDTPFALGMLALVGPRFPIRLRAFLLTVAVVDDVIALGVIATVYSEDVELPALLAALGLFAAIVVLRAVGLRAVGAASGVVYTLLGVATWVALFESGVEPVVASLAVGLLAYAYPARARRSRARDGSLSALPRAADAGARSLGAPRAYLGDLRQRAIAAPLPPWTSYVIVPLFALANAGIEISGDFLSRAYTSPITLGILLGYVLGKPIGIVGGAWLVTRLTRGRVRPPVGWAAGGAPARSPASASRCRC
jgi:Na+/H+ antiporter NhaA